MWTSLTSALGQLGQQLSNGSLLRTTNGSALSQGWDSNEGFINTFSSIWTFVKSIWQGIQTLSHIGLEQSGTELSVWSWINNTTLVFTSVWNFIKWIWTSIKNTVVYWTGQSE